MEENCKKQKTKTKKQNNKEVSSFFSLFIPLSYFFPFFSSFFPASLFLSPFFHCTFLLSQSSFFHLLFFVTFLSFFLSFFPSFPFSWKKNSSYCPHPLMLSAMFFSFSSYIQFFPFFFLKHFYFSQYIFRISFSLSLSHSLSLSLSHIISFLLSHFSHCFSFILIHFTVTLLVEKCHIIDKPSDITY